MSQSNAAIESRINDDLTRYPKDSIRQAAMQNFDVSTRSLQRRVNRMRRLSSRSPNNKALSEAQELAICEYIERLDLWEMSARLQMPERAANYHLSLDGLNCVIGPHWIHRFLDRHPEYFKRKQNH